MSRRGVLGVERGGVEGGERQNVRRYRGFWVLGVVEKGVEILGEFCNNLVTIHAKNGPEPRKSYAFYSKTWSNPPVSVTLL